MTTLELLSELQRRDVRLSVKDNGRLLLDAPQGAVDDDLQSEVRAHKAELLQLLSDSLPPCPLCGGQFDAGPAERGGGCLRLVCVHCEYFALAYPQGTADSVCLRCETTLTRQRAAPGWARLVCPRCGWTRYERPEPAPPRPRGDTASLKRLWREAWQRTKDALNRRDHDAADRAFEEWYEVDQTTRRALGDGYAAWTRLVMLHDANSEQKT